MTLATLPLLTFLFLATPCFAASPTDSSELLKISYKTHFDMYYLHNFNEPFPVNALNSTTVSSATLPLGNNPLRLYDGYHNQMSVNLVELSIEGTRNTTSFLIDFDFGQAADLNARSSNTTTRVQDE